MKKKGFTLIEIIICVVLLTLITTTSVITINSARKNDSVRKLQNVTDNLTNALKVYIELNSEIEENLILNTKAAVVTLETLKNEGLIEENIINPSTGTEFDYKKSYFTLLEGTSGEIPLAGESYDCNLDLVGIEVITSWNLNNLNTNDVIYICPRKDYKADIDSLKTSVSDISSRLDAIESSGGYAGGGSGSSGDVKEDFKIATLFDELTYTAKGTNPNNYVEFEVVSDNTKMAYFEDSEDKNLWRIVTINSNNQIQIMYPKPAMSNNELNFIKEQSRTWCDSGYDPTPYCTFYKLNHYPTYTSTSKYYNYSNNNTDWFVGEVMEDVTVEGSKKQMLYNAIVNKDWIVPYQYFPYYNFSSYTPILNSASTKEMYMGVININEINSSINISDSWLFDYEMLIGYGELWTSSTDYEYNIYNNAGSLYKNTTNYAANRCTNYQCSKDKDSKYDRYLDTNKYYPVVVLSEKVKLIEQTCPEGSIRGSKECPFKLSCPDC